MNELLAMSLKTHEGEQLVHAAGEVLALHAVERREEAKVFLGGPVLVERVVLGHKPDACSRRAEGAPSPSTRTVPEVGTSTPMMRFTSVVLPQPEGPKRQRISPAATESEMSFSARRVSRRRGPGRP